MANLNEKARYWNAVAYPENMREDWREMIGDIIGHPLAYCIHDKDNLAPFKAKDGTEDEIRQRKTHVHILIAYSNTTTAKVVLNIVNKLSIEGKCCANKVEACHSVRNSFEYLIHNTESARKLGKYLYKDKERICVNNFDIGIYEQLSLADKEAMITELENDIIENGFLNYSVFFAWVCNNKTSEYRKIVRSYSNHLRHLIKGNYHSFFNKS